MKTINKLMIPMMVLSIMFSLQGCGPMYVTTAEPAVTYNNPSWAPEYYAGTRYYYLPDVESYYDLTTSRFVYMDNGNWIYSTTLPNFYAGFSLNDCFVVIVQSKVYEPWMHHQFYISHYPRYYYHDYYDHSGIPYVRGYNEDRQSAFYWSNNDRNHAREWDTRYVANPRGFKYSTADRDVQKKYEYNNKTNDRGNSGYDKGSKNQNTNSSRNDNVIYRDANSNNNNRSGNMNNNASNNNNNNNNYSNSNNKNNGNNGYSNANSGSRATGQNDSGRNADNAQTTTGRVNQDSNSTRSGTQNQGQVNNGSSRESSSTTRTETNSRGTNYYGRTIGQPVKADKQMRQPSTSNRSTTTRSADSSRSADQQQNRR